MQTSLFFSLFNFLTIFAFDDEWAIHCHKFATFLADLPGANRISELQVYQVTDPLNKSILMKLFPKSTFL